MGLLALLPSTHALPCASRADGHDIAAGVRRHCRLLGVDDSNTVAAVAWALRSPGATLDCVRAGQRRAESLHFRQRPAAAPTRA